MLATKNYQQPEIIPMSRTNPDDLLSPEEVAALTGMSHSRVCQLLRKRQMNGRKVRGRMWEIQRREAERFIEVAATGRPRTGRINVKHRTTSRQKEQESLAKEAAKLKAKKTRRSKAATS